jgi:hypothetical protein
VKQEACHQDNLEYFNKDIRTHKVAECVVPGTVVVAQDAEVGAGMEQQEDH